MLCSRTQTISQLTLFFLLFPLQLTFNCLSKIHCIRILWLGFQSVISSIIITSTFHVLQEILRSRTGEFFHEKVQSLGSIGEGFPLATLRLTIQQSCVLTKSLTIVDKSLLTRTVGSQWVLVKIVGSSLVGPLPSCDYLNVYIVDCWRENQAALLLTQRNRRMMP